MRSQRLLEIRKEINEVLKELKNELNAKVYLFGSYAKGTHTLESDVDIVVISEKFKGINFVDRVEMIRLKLPENVGFDIIALTPEELKEKKKKAFYKDISKYWIEIK